MKIVIVTGGFDPIHSGHIEMFRKAAEQSDFVVACVNSDNWVTKKRGLNFLPIEERLNILSVNNDLEAEWEELRNLGNQYRELEKHILEKQATWDRLKSMPPPEID